MERINHLRAVGASDDMHEPNTSEVESELAKLGERSRDIFRHIVESYLETGVPVGSRNISRAPSINLSPASVRNVMSDLEALGLIFAPHTSAGRLPTELGLRFFVDALMQFGELTENERQNIEAHVAAGQQHGSVETVLTEAGNLLSACRAAHRSCWRRRTTCGCGTWNSCGSTSASASSCSWVIRARWKTG